MLVKPLKTGDEICVLAPSFKKAAADDAQQLRRAEQRLLALGYTLSLSKRLENDFLLGAAKPAARAEELNAAYANKNVKAILAYRGGWLANEVLPFLDWKLIKTNPKPLIGFSDITTLLNAIYAKTKVEGFYGPNFRTLGQETSWEFTLSNLDASLRQLFPLKLAKSKKWSDMDQKSQATPPWKVLSQGTGAGIILGGNISTFYVLQGTPYQPVFSTDWILVVEDDDEAGEYTTLEFARRLESILQLPGARKNLRGILIGRFQPGCKVDLADIEQIIRAKELTEIPIIANLDFGHTVPMVSLPIGGKISIKADSTETTIKIG